MMQFVLICMFDRFDSGRIHSEIIVGAVEGALTTVDWFACPNTPAANNLDRNSAQNRVERGKAQQEISLFFSYIHEKALM